MAYETKEKKIPKGILMKHFIILGLALVSRYGFSFMFDFFISLAIGTAGGFYFLGGYLERKVGEGRGGILNEPNDSKQRYKQRYKNLWNTDLSLNSELRTISS